MPDTAPELKDKEESGAADNESFYRDEQEQVGRRFGKGKVSGLRGKLTKKRLIIGGTVLASIAGLFSAALLFLLPFKVTSIMTNLEKHSSALVVNASQKETDKLLTSYLTRYFLPALKSCPASVTRECNPIPANSNPVLRVFRGWRTAKFEDKLATDMGLEFKYLNGHYFMKVPGMTGNGAVIDDFVHENQLQLFSLDDYIQQAKDPQWQKVSRSEVRQAVKDAVQKETRWKGMLTHFKIGRLLEEKYGIKRCIIFCGFRDKLANDIQAQKTAAKLYLVERVVQPNNEALALVFSCFFSAATNNNCDPTKYDTAPCQVDVNCEENGAPENKETDAALRSSLEDLAKTFGIADGNALKGLLDKLEKDGLRKFAIKFIMLKVFNATISDSTAEALSKAVPLVGWLNMAFQIVNFAHKGETALKKLTYIRNAAAAVAIYSMYRTYADECKSGHCNGRELGSMVQSLGPVAANADKTDLKGGTAGAEQTALYSKLLGDGSGSSAKTYTCDGTNKSPVGGSGLNLTCPEEKLSQNSDVLAALKSAVDSSGLSTLADVWNNSVGLIYSLFSGILSFVISVIAPIANAACDIPIVGYLPPWGPYCAARDAIKAATTKIIDFATNILFPSPFSENMSGGRIFDMAAAGADASAQDAAHAIQGAAVITSQQSSAVLAQQNLDDLQSYHNESFFSRLFDTNSQYSPITKLALAMPSNPALTIQSATTAIISNPLGQLWHNVSSIFSHSLTTRAMAATGDTGGDPFGVTQYGYPDGPLPIHTNPAGPMEGQDFWRVNDADFWDTYCTPTKADGTPNPYYITDNWNKDASTTLDANGMPENTKYNECLLVQSNTGEDGGIYDSSLLTPDDLADESGASSSSTSGPSDISAYKNPLRDVQQNGSLTAKRIDQGVDYGGHGPVYALGSGTATYVKYFSDSGWPGGTFVNYTLSDGPAKGLAVYFAENCAPPSTPLKAGDPVYVNDSSHPDTVLCNMVDADPHIETGWAVPGTGLAMAHDVWTGSVDNENNYTAYGLNFSQLLQRLGAPGGTIKDGATELGSLGNKPDGSPWPTW